MKYYRLDSIQSIQIIDWFILTQADIYHGIESADREIFLIACKDESIRRSQEIAG